MSQFAPVKKSLHRKWFFTGSISQSVQERLFACSNVFRSTQIQDERVKIRTYLFEFFNLPSKLLLCIQSKQVHQLSAVVHRAKAVVGHMGGCHRMTDCTAKYLGGRIFNGLCILVHRPAPFDGFSGCDQAFAPQLSHLEGIIEKRLDGKAKRSLQMLGHRKCPLHQASMVLERQQPSPMLSDKTLIAHRMNAGCAPIGGRDRCLSTAPCGA